MSATRVHLDNAVKKIAFDHFHVAKMLCSVIDKTRQNELNKIARENRKLAHRSRYLWLHCRNKLNENKRVRLGLA
ncbi:transposase [Providencia rettgeri]|nr:transposase [Providencia rettgeri]TXM77785.1 transposase [Providencia rettgeri]